MFSATKLTVILRLPNDLFLKGYLCRQEIKQESYVIALFK